MASEPTELERAIARLEAMADRWNATTVWHEPRFTAGKINVTTEDLWAASVVVPLLRRLTGPLDTDTSAAPAACKPWCGTVAKLGESAERVGAVSGEPHPFIDYCTRECFTKRWGHAASRTLVAVLPKTGASRPAAPPTSSGEPGKCECEACDCALIASCKCECHG